MYICIHIYIYIYICIYIYIYIALKFYKEALRLRPTNTDAVIHVAYDDVEEVRYVYIYIYICVYVMYMYICIYARRICLVFIQFILYSICSNEIKKGGSKSLTTQNRPQVRFAFRAVT